MYTLKKEYIMTTREFYLANKEKVLESNRKRRRENLDKSRKQARDSYHKRKWATTPNRLLRYAKARAVKKGLDFDLTLEDIVIPELCPIFKQPLLSGDSKFNPSIDRIDPDKGYTKDNIQIISKLANSMKWNASPKELEAFCRGYLSLLKEVT
jgi:hypothetical protein